MHWYIDVILPKGPYFWQDTLELWSSYGVSFVSAQLDLNPSLLSLCSIMNHNEVPLHFIPHITLLISMEALKGRPHEVFKNSLCIS